MNTEIPPPSSPFSRSKSKRILRHASAFISLALTVACLWGIIFDRWRPSDWGTPPDYSSDALLSMGMMRHAETGDLGLFGYINSEKVGAPFLGNLNDFPLSERPIFWIGGMLSRLVGLAVATNILIISAHIIAALSFYIAARLWRVSALFAWTFSIPYAFIPYALMLSNAQLPMLFYGLLPLQLYCCWYLSRTPHLSLKETRFKLLLFIALISGLNQIYFIFSFLALYAFAIIRRILNKQPNLALATAPIGLTFLTTTFTLIGHVFYWIEHGKPSAIFRQYNHLEIGGLKIIDLFLPSQGHGFGLFSKVYERYLTEGAYTSSESYRVYLGLLAILGIAILFVRSFQRALTRSPIPIPALVVFLVLAFACFGGLNSIYSLFSEFYLIRTTTRYACIVGTIGLLYLALVLSRWSRAWPNGLRVALAISLSIIGLVDQARPTIPRYHNSSSSISNKIHSDKNLVAGIEARLNKGGMIFMLPYMPFPEAISMYRLTDYELLRPFLYSEKLRFSYGSNKGRPETNWPNNLIQKPSEKIISLLEDYGFSGILINRYAYADGGESLIRGFKDANRPPSFEERDEWVFIPLIPSPSPVLPSVSFVFPNHWSPLEGSNSHWWQWSGKVDGSDVYIYSDRDGVYYLNFNLRSASQGKIDISLNGSLIRSVNFDYGTHIPLSIGVDIRKGKNILTFSSNARPVPSTPGFSANRISFAIEDFNIEELDGAIFDFSDAWFPLEGPPPNQWRWTSEVTGSRITVYAGKSGVYNLSAFVATISKRNVYISLNGNVVSTLNFPHSEERYINIPIELKKGENTLVFSSDEAPVRPGTNDMRLLAFYIKEWKIQPIE